jgi:nucleoid-associated protein YgaU
MGILDNLKNALGGWKQGREKGHSATPGSAGETGQEGDSYTVQSGDTLWKIAASCYGDGSKYMQIFEANRDQLETPEHIAPGQVLRIPAAAA